MLYTARIIELFDVIFHILQFTILPIYIISIDVAIEPVGTLKQLNKIYNLLVQWIKFSTYFTDLHHHIQIIVKCTKKQIYFDIYIARKN